jgi:hypothetical protein
MTINRESLLNTCLEIDTAKGVSIVKKECAQAVFYGDCSVGDAAWAISRLQPEPLVPRSAPTLDGEVLRDSLRNPRRFYIECLQDKALTPNAQQWMYTTSKCEAVYALPTSHSPFLSAPATLAHRLLEIERRISQYDTTAMQERG